MKNENQTQSKHTPGQILFEGWFPNREPGLLPSAKLNWDGRTIQMFTENLEQAEIDMRFLASAPDLLRQLSECREALRPFARLVIEKCPRCEGTGQRERGEINEACGQCGGTGEETGNPHPDEIRQARTALANATESGVI